MLFRSVTAKVIRAGGAVCDLPLRCAGLTAEERLILQEGCLMNYYMSCRTGNAGL